MLIVLASMTSQMCPMQRCTVSLAVEWFADVVTVPIRQAGRTRSPASRPAPGSSRSGTTGTDAASGRNSRFGDAQGQLLGARGAALHASHLLQTLPQSDCLHDSSSCTMSVHLSYLKACER